MEIPPGHVDLLKAVGAPGPVNYKEVTFKFDHRYRTLGASEDSVTAPQATFRPLGNGIFQETRYVENNGFPLSRTFGLSFLGALNLKRENATPQSKLTTFDSVVKEFKPFKFDPARLTPGNSFTVDHAIGFPLQEFNFRWSKMTCTCEKTGSAAELNPKVKGNAIWFACEGSNEAGAQSRGANVYLAQYGMMITTKYADSRFTSNDTIADFIEK